MIKISRTEAYNGLDKFDLEVIDQKLDNLMQSDERKGKNATIQYFLENENTIVLIAYFDEIEIATYSFKNKGTLTENAINIFKEKKIIS